jgi:hypothetical protein
MTITYQQLRTALAAYLIRHCLNVFPFSRPVRLGEMALADGVPRSLTGLLIPQKQRADESAGRQPNEKKKEKDAQVFW